MQRFFSSYPAGFPGFGLLLLRIVVAYTSFILGRTVTPLLSGTSLVVAMHLAGWLALFSVVLGLVAPLGCVVLLIELLSVLALCPVLRSGTMESKLILLNLGAMLVTLATSGPGAFSVDARLFGRREIIIPN